MIRQRKKERRGQQEQDASAQGVSTHGKNKIIICVPPDVGAGVPPVRGLTESPVGGSSSQPRRAALDRTSEDARAYILRALAIRALAVFLMSATSSGVAVLT